MKNILIVDDSKTICKTLEKLIKDELGYNPIIAHSKAECEVVLRKYNNNFAVALLDLGLPDAPNGEVVDFVAKLNIPSVVLTGSTDKEDTFRDKDIVDYVIKDGRFSFEYILNLVKRIVVNHHLKVIIANSSKESAQHTIELLKRYQLTCFYAQDGREALDILSREKDIKIIFTDYNMPNLDGLELTKHVRRLYSKDELSIITITGSQEHKKVAKFLKYGANDFLYKGFSDEEFYARLNSDLEMLELFADIKYKANRDYLTNMYNRRYFFDEGQLLYKKSVKQNKDICVAMIDIDKFKNINDTYGHDIGDIAIKEIALVVDKYFDENSIISRFGGEEFCILVVDETEEEFVNTLEAIRAEFEINVIHTNKGDIQYTVSIGYSFNHGDSLDDMVNNSDAGLYIAKNSGRNQVRKSN